MEKAKRVIALAPMPPEACAYALARYSRSPDSIRESLEWVRQHDSRRFLEHYYFQYGHASIADLGHLALCFEGISELAAIEIEDEPLWDGQAKSSRYQDFGRAAPVVPPELSPAQAESYLRACAHLLATYRRVHEAVTCLLAGRLPRPADMPEESYRRNLAARAFDVARYLLFLGAPTNVGQVTSIRTLEKQVRRLKVSEYAELREVAAEICEVLGEPPGATWYEGLPVSAVAPTLARFAEPDEYQRRVRERLRKWACENLPPARNEVRGAVDLVRPVDTEADAVATLLYPVTDRPFRELYDLARGWSAVRRREVLELAVAGRGERDELPRAFRSAPYAFDIVMDIGAWRDLHRHRRCHQYRQAFTARLGYDTPPLIAEAGLEAEYRSAVESALVAAAELPEPASHYLLPFAARSRFLFKMDFAEADYICRLRTSVKGHFSYRRIAWEMKRALEQAEPELGRLIQATPPWIEDPLRR
ncbi:MAG: FAD-dependent thymidylate synthase [Bryobacterales bacterium]|nr:FAD-dependent thymidylate synthase [Bryobacteraceae bacterium]MDW8129431.1 FAD-dependent thymidylate synthase [Bryobacterales bacterium]